MEFVRDRYAPGDTVVADFSAAPLNGTAPLTVTFSNLSSGATDYEWSFGDGGTSVLQAPTHVYTQTGSFTVILTATSGAESDTEVKTDYISVAAPVTVTADLSASPTTGTVPLTVTFTNLSTSSGEIDGYEWDFGDGDEGAGEIVEHSYSEGGEYPVTLTVIDDDGYEDQITKSIEVEAEYEFETALLIGRITDLNAEGDVFTFDSVMVRYITFSPFSFQPQTIV